MNVLALRYLGNAENGVINFFFTDQIHVQQGSTVALTDMSMLIANRLYITEDINFLPFTVNGEEFDIGTVFDPGSYTDDALFKEIEDSFNSVMECVFVPGTPAETIAGIQFRVGRDAATGVITISFNSQDPTYFSLRTSVGCTFDSPTRLLTKTTASAGFTAWSTDTVPFCKGPGYYCATILSLNGAVAVSLVREQQPPSGDPEEMLLSITADDTTGNYLIIEDQNETDTGIAWQVNDMFGVKRTFGGVLGVFFRGGVETELPSFSDYVAPSNVYGCLSLAGPLGFAAGLGAAVNDQDNVFHCIDPFLANLPAAGKNDQTITVDFSENPLLADMLGFQPALLQLVGPNGDFDSYRVDPFNKQLLSIRVTCPQLAGTVDNYDTVTRGKMPILATVDAGTLSKLVTYQPFNPVQCTIDHDLFISNLTMRIDDVDEVPINVQGAAMFTLVISPPNADADSS